MKLLGFITLKYLISKWLLYCAIYFCQSGKLESKLSSAQTLELYSFDDFAFKNYEYIVFSENSPILVDLNVKCSWANTSRS